jgi:RimJ/RimL family protein N-acetyltransferase
VFELANDPATRAASFHSELIPHDVHVRWYENTLAGSARKLFVAETTGTALGIIRFDFLASEPGVAEIGIAIAAEMRGRGLSRGLLAAATETARTLGIARIVARIKPENTPSIRAFQAAGYRQSEEVLFTGAPAHHYELEVG